MAYNGGSVGGSCSEEGRCSFINTVARNPVMLAKYASMHRYCRGGEHDRCVRFHAYREGGRPASNLLPSGNLDAGLTGEPTRVLVVDDTPVFLKLMEGLAAAHVPGAEIVGVTSGHQALNMLRAQRFDLVVSDFHMPEMHGGELVSEMRRRTETIDVPVIVFTTDQNAELRSAVLAQGRTRWVVKSPDKTPFATAVRELLFEGRN